jgi:hypothetical protein
MAVVEVLVHGIEKREKYPSWQSVNENSLPLRRQKRCDGGKSS